MHEGPESGTNYLRTLIYGLSILIIMALQASSASTNQSNSCIATSGYLCANPILNSNGILLVSIGSATTITVTGTGCSPNALQPGFSPTHVTLAAGAPQNLTFFCPVPQGQLVSGTIWIEYGKNGRAVTTQALMVGRVRVVVNTVATPTPPASGEIYPIVGAIIALAVILIVLLIYRGKRGSIAA